MVRESYSLITSAKWLAGWLAGWLAQELCQFITELHFFVILSAYITAYPFLMVYEFYSTRKKWNCKG